MSFFFVDGYKEHEDTFLENTGSFVKVARTSLRFLAAGIVHATFLKILVFRRNPKIKCIVLEEWKVRLSTTLLVGRRRADLGRSSHNRRQECIPPASTGPSSTCWRTSPRSVSRVNSESFDLTY